MAGLGAGLGSGRSHSLPVEMLGIAPEPLEAKMSKSSGRARSKERRDGRTTGSSASSSRRRGESNRSPSKGSRAPHLDSSLNGGITGGPDTPSSTPPSSNHNPATTGTSHQREAERAVKESRGTGGGSGGSISVAAKSHPNRKATVSPGPWKIPGSDKLPSTLRSGSSTVSR